MDKREIKQELRRSATKDENPMWHCAFFAFDEVCDWKAFREGEFLGNLSNKDIRTFFLLVAEAL